MINRSELSSGVTPREIIRSSGSFSSIEVPEDASSYFRESLSHQVFGQPQAIDVVSNILIRSEAGIGNTDKPKGTMIFLGQTGVGKTELAKAVSKTVFGADDWKNHFQRIDCTDFADDASINRLRGATPGYVGYGDDTLISPEFLKKGGVILFDEIEKADPSLYNWLLPIMEEGSVKVRLPSDEDNTANKDRKKVTEQTLDFTQAYLIFTSNIGASMLQAERSGNSSIGFNHERKHANLREIAIRELKKHFNTKPEFLGRIGESNFVVFNELEREEYLQIFVKTLNKINQSQRGDVVNIQVTPECMNRLIDQAVGHGEYGARDIESTIDSVLLSDIAKIKYRKTLPSGSVLIADVDDETGEVIYWKQNVSSQEATAPVEQNDSKPEIILPSSAGEMSTTQVSQ